MAKDLKQPDLLGSIRDERAKLETAIARAGDARMTQPWLEGGRSTKDLLAHISAWEKIGMALVRNYQPMQAPAPGETGASSDPINEKVFEQNRTRPVSEVLAESKRTYGELIALVEEMTEAQLTAPLGAGQPGAEGSPSVTAIIHGNSDEHYREHTAQINEWLDSTE